MQWKISGNNCSIDFYGDTFETEDQRNWTDASYKTYCTPLNLPRPAKILKGQKIYQKIVLKIDTGDKVGTTDTGLISITIKRKKLMPFPRIGICKSTRLKPLTPGEAEIIKKLGFDHYRIELFLFNNDWATKAETAFREAISLGSKTELVLFFDDDYANQVALFIEFINTKKTDLALIILFHKKALSTPDLLTDQVAPFLRRALPGINICCGTNANFVQLNRNRPQSVHSDYICYSIHPQEHASDNLSLVENLQAQRDTVESAIHFASNKKIWISPVNIQRRFNANISNYELPAESDNFPPQADSRLMSLFGGCWIAGSLKYLIEGGAEGVTLLETVGERGIIQGDFNSGWPIEFKSVKGMIFPLFHVLKFILKYKSDHVLESISSNPLNVESLVISDGNKMKMILVNFTKVIQKINIRGRRADFSIRKLNESTYSEAVTDDGWLEKTETTKVRNSVPMMLDPFSITFVEG